MSRVVFSLAARQDRKLITASTVEQFGIAQASRLRDRFETVVNDLLKMPHLGVEKTELDPPGHSFRYYSVLSRFIVVYEPTDDGIRVVRLLHGARDLAAELHRDAGDD